MQKMALIFVAVLMASTAVYGGTETFSGKEMKQVAPAPCAEYYRDNEWNVAAWGTYAFTDNDEVRNVEIFTGTLAPPTFLTQNYTGDRYLETDHAWGGGADVKYFLKRYFGIGVEGYVLNARRVVPSFELGTGLSREVEHRAIGSVLGSFTLRYPIRCSRFSPYVWGAGGAIFGGGERDIFDPFVFNTSTRPATRHTDGSTEAVGQFGGGLETRFNPRIGWTVDFSWNVVDGGNNNFGMVRSGINFAF